LDDPTLLSHKFREKISCENSINLTNNKENQFNGNGVINLSETDKDRKLENFLGNEGRKDIEELMLKNLLGENSEGKTWGGGLGGGVKLGVLRSP
jgi:hypothetical protein